VRYNVSHYLNNLFFCSALGIQDVIPRLSRIDAHGILDHVIGLPQTELARELEITVSGIGYVVGRGEIVAEREGYTLIDSVI